MSFFGLGQDALVEPESIAAYIPPEHEGTVLVLEVGGPGSSMALLPGEQDSSRDGGQLEAEDGSVFFVNPWGKHL